VGATLRRNGAAWTGLVLGFCLSTLEGQRPEPMLAQGSALGQMSLNGKP